jgi:hypothetical protein
LIDSEDKYAANEIYVATEAQRTQR